MTSAPQLSVGLVGGGRSRDGLGPFLAGFLEDAGGRIVAVSGRDLDRARHAADELGRRLGHEVAPYPGVGSLSHSGVDALVVASPAEHHLEALEAAAAAGLHCLCEKPLVPVEQEPAAQAAIAAFFAGERVLLENCQWPQVLPALWRLYPSLRDQPVREVAMGLGPARPGPAMVADSLSHFLSVIQALVPVDAATEIASLRRIERPGDPQRQTLEVELRQPFPLLRGRLELTLCPAQPRPAWLQVNGCRMDRKLGPKYRMSFGVGEHQVPIDDPMRSLVYGFVQLTQRLDRDRIRQESRTIAQRLRLYGDIVRRP